MQLTTHQQQVLEKLRQEHAPLTAYALLDKLRSEGFSAPTQIYRALDQLLSHGLIHRLESMNAYVSCSHGHQHGLTAFSICDQCGHIDEFVSNALSHCLSDLAATQHFVMKSATVEMRGLCAQCAKSV